MTLQQEIFQGLEYGFSGCGDCRPATPFYRKNQMPGREPKWENQGFPYNRKADSEAAYFFMSV